MPEATFGPEDLRQAVEAAGGRYVGLQARPEGGPPLLLFNDPRTRNTLALPVLELIAAQVRARLAGAQPRVPAKFVQIAAALKGDGEPALFALDSRGTAWELIAGDGPPRWGELPSARAPLPNPTR